MLDRGDQPFTKEADKQFKQVVPLGLQIRQFAFRNAQVVGDSKHADQSCANRAVIAFNFW